MESVYIRRIGVGVFFRSDGGERGPGFLGASMRADERVTVDDELRVDDDDAYAVDSGGSSSGWRT